MAETLGRSGPALGEPLRNGQFIPKELSPMRIKGLSAVFAALVVAALVAPLSAPGISKPSGGKNPYNYVDLKTVPKPNVTGAEIITGLEEFVAQHPLRQSTLQIDNQGSSEFLAAEAKKYGFKTRILELETGDSTVPMVRTVEAIKKGTTKPDEWIAFIAHYDTVEQTVQGAYD